tara:strand:+ start:87065 stop:87973 length:909 start_codon:yes stop_codon:yes gene_type:complete
MVTNKATLDKIRKIIEKHYARLTISVLGKAVYSQSELDQFRALGIDTNKDDSFLELVYNHNFINPATEPDAPTSVEDMKIQQKMIGMVPQGEAHEYAVESLNEKTKQLIEKLRMNITSSVEGIIYQNNDEYKNDALQNLKRTFESDQLVKESSLGKVKQKLKELSGQANRDWQRVALTEMSNAVGVGSVDRIVSLNASKDLDEVYVYRVIVGDEKTCKYCRRFYQDADGSPKVYKLSTLLGNGTNYGKKTDAWQAVVGATHPNTRTSQIIELPSGWKVDPGGKMSFIGVDEFPEYIQNKLTA